MERKTVIFTVEVSVANESDHAWQKNVRLARKTIKDTIGNYQDMKIVKIETKEV